MSATIQSLRNAKPAQVQITFNDKELGFVYSNTGELMSTVELSSSFTRPVLMAVLKVQKESLDKLNITDINKFELTTIKIVLTQLESKSGYTFTRRFMITEVVDSTLDGLQGKDYLIKCVDVYGYAICSNNSQFRSSVYSGKPVDNVINYLNDLFKKVKEDYKEDNEIKISHDVKYEYKDLPDEYSKENKENLFQIVNGSPLVSLKEYCLKYNIRLWQDYNGFHIVQNPMLSSFPEFNSYLSDRLPSDNPYYIWDYVLDKSNRENTMSKRLKRVSVTDGKHTEYKQVDVDMLLNAVVINGDIENCKKFIPKETTPDTANTNVTIESLTYEEFYKALQYKTLCVYLQGDIGSLYPGIKVNLNMLYNNENANKQYQGDNDISKKWFVVGCTYKAILGTDGKCFCRLVLNRFDNPKDITAKEDTSIYKIAKNKYNGEISLSGIVDDVLAAFDNTFNRLKNSFNSIKDSLLNIGNFLKDWFNSTISDAVESINDLKNTLESFDDNLKAAIEDTKHARLIYNSSDYSYNNKLINDLETEFKGIDLDSLFANFYESFEQMELDDKSKTEFKLVYETAKRDFNKFKDSVNDLFRDYYNKNNRNITYKSLDTSTNSQYQTNSTKSKEELNILREKQLSKIRDRQNITKE